MALVIHVANEYGKWEQDTTGWLLFFQYLLSLFAIEKIFFYRF